MGCHNIDTETAINKYNKYFKFASVIAEKINPCSLTTYWKINSILGTREKNISSTNALKQFFFSPATDDKKIDGYLDT